MTDFYNISLRCMVKRHGLLAVLAELQTIMEVASNAEIPSKESVMWGVCGDAIEDCAEHLANDLGYWANKLR